MNQVREDLLGMKLADMLYGFESLAGRLTPSIFAAPYKGPKRKEIHNLSVVKQRLQLICSSRFNQC